MFITTIRKDIDIKNLMAGHDYNIAFGVQIVFAVIAIMMMLMMIFQSLESVLRLK